MSNHSGSYMLNEILRMLEKNKFFEFMGKEKTHEFIREVLSVGHEYYCNDGEIMEEIGEKIGICYCCKEYGADFENGICKKCRENR